MVFTKTGYVRNAGEKRSPFIERIDCFMEVLHIICSRGPDAVITERPRPVIGIRSLVGCYHHDRHARIFGMQKLRIRSSARPRIDDQRFLTEIQPDTGAPGHDQCKHPSIASIRSLFSCPVPDCDANGFRQPERCAIPDKNIVSQAGSGIAARQAFPYRTRMKLAEDGAACESDGLPARLTEIRVLS